MMTQQTGKQKSSKRRLFSIFNMPWVFLMAAIIIIGSVMSFGLIGYFFLDMDQNSALAMVWMIIPMLIVFTVAIHIMLMGAEQRMQKLADAIHAVAAGDLETQIDLTDAEEYKQLYQDFNLMTKELRATRKEMEAFTNEFAHEFKTPITSISGFADYLVETGEGIETPERMEYLELISSQAQRLCHLSQNTLLLSKVEALQSVSNKEHYYLAEQLRQCVILFDRDLEQKKIDLEIDEDLAIPFCGNREIVEHIWINLLSNAVKFTPEGGRIRILAQQESGTSGDSGSSAETPRIVTVTVEDSGSGMDAETLSHIFEKYYQNDTVSETRGSGIGLSIVRRIAELCGGSVRAESEPGKGSRFIVQLPMI